MELLWERMHLTWVYPGSVRVEVDGRTVTVGGEPGEDGNPDFLVYAELLLEWDDGTPFMPGEKQEILRNLVYAARKRRWKFQIDPPT